MLPQPAAMLRSLRWMRDEACLKQIALCAESQFALILLLSHAVIENRFPPFRQHALNAKPRHHRIGLHQRQPLDAL